MAYWQDTLRAKDKLDRAQLNVQNSINENFPDPDNYEPNDGPKFRNNEEKGLILILGILGVIEPNSPIIKGLLLLNETQDKNDSQSQAEGAASDEDLTDKTLDSQNNEKMNDENDYEEDDK